MSILQEDDLWELVETNAVIEKLLD